MKLKVPLYPSDVLRTLNSWGAEIRKKVFVSSDELDAFNVGLQSQAPWWGGTSVGPANVYQIVVEPELEDLEIGQKVSFIAHQTNTGPATLQVATTSSASIKAVGVTSTLGPGSIVINQVVDCVWDGAVWQLTIIAGDVSTPSGSIIGTARSTAPNGWVLCDGTAISRTTYATLFAAIGTTYGVGDGSSTFNVPDTRGRFLLSKATAGTGNALAGTGGSLDHTHTVPAHFHALGTGADLNITSAAKTSGAGSAHSHTPGTLNITSAAKTTGTESANHTHAVVANAVAAGALGANQLAIQNVTGAATDYGLGGTATAATIGNSGAQNANHTHSMAHTHASGEFAGSTASESSHTHSIAHTHAVGEFAGRIGLVTGGVDGNAAMTSGANNPAYLVINYMIRV